MAQSLRSSGRLSLSVYRSYLYTKSGSSGRFSDQMNEDSPKTGYFLSICTENPFRPRGLLYKCRLYSLVGSITEVAFHEAGIVR